MSGLDILKEYKKYIEGLTPEQLIKELQEAGMKAELAKDGVGKIIMID